jgi:hypothetical protein
MNIETFVEPEAVVIPGELQKEDYEDE